MIPHLSVITTGIVAPDAPERAAHVASAPLIRISNDAALNSSFYFPAQRKQVCSTRSTHTRAALKPRQQRRNSGLAWPADTSENGEITNEDNAYQP